ncbi:MAG: acyl-ACP--UDP-N-acetylglucosamine O-acyltransferase [Vulcanimicrobiaceae bacterium]
MIHPTAIVHPKAAIGEGAEIGPFCVIGEHVSIGARTTLLAHVVVNGFTTIGEDTRIHPFCSIGAPSQDRKYHGEVAFTTIGSRTEIREYVSVHRATGENEVTSVGDDTLLLAYVHIAHNCRIGNHVTMSSTAQLAGHVIVEDHVTIGGQTGVHQFVRIGEFAMVGGISKITRDVPPYFLVEGNPATPYGLNKVGLRRAEFTPEIVSELKECYGIMYRSGHNISQAAEAMRGVVRSDRGRHLLAFIDAPTERGIVK